MVSVCIASYNGANYIKEQIASILPQLKPDDEIVVSDDGSTDNTISIIQSFCDKRIIVISNEVRHGFVGNFNNSLQHSKGDIIFLCDQDDIWENNKVSIVCSYLSKYDLIVHDANVIDGDGRNKGYTYFSLMHKGTGFLLNLWKTRFLGCCMAFRREVLEYCLPIPEGVIAHDYWIGMYSLTHFKVKFVPDVLISYRRHGGNASPSGEKSNNSLFYKLFTKRWNLLIAIGARRLVKN